MQEIVWMKIHTYKAHVSWTGNRGEGTAAYRAYDRTHRIEIAGKPVLTGSADPMFRGDSALHNPEDLLLASISACHMLWYLHLASEAGVVVTAYEDHAEAGMSFEANGAGQFTSATLHPAIRIAAGDPALAQAIHGEAHAKCFIARSLNFPVRCEGVIEGP